MLLSGSVASRDGGHKKHLRLWYVVLRNRFPYPGHAFANTEGLLKGPYTVFRTQKNQNDSAKLRSKGRESILGSDCWNALFDSLLRLESHDESFLVVHVDDVATLVNSSTVNMLSEYLEK